MLEQVGNELNVQSDMVVVNREREGLKQITLFLNPGLDVTGVRVDGKNVEWQRDCQVLAIASGLAAGDSARVEVDYRGRVDDRFCDIHLTDAVYEDVFGGDRFFAQGRTGAFVEGNLLLVTPAVAWYPVALPPVNPLMPMATGRDFTRFRLVVKHPLQRVVISQGESIEQEDGVVFECNKAGMSGISICGANYASYEIPMDERLDFQVNAVSEREKLEKRVAGIDKKPWIALWKDTLNYQLERKCAATSWYHESNPRLYLLEVPVSFRLDAHAGKTESGLVEPGMIFWRERGFDMDIIHVLEGRKIVTDGRRLDGRIEELVRWYKVIFASTETGWNSHPFEGIGGRKVRRENDHCGGTVWNEEPVWVYCKKYPFMGKIFDKLAQTNYLNHAQGLALIMLDVKEYLDDFVGRSLPEILAAGKGVNLLDKEQELWMRLMTKIPMRELQASLDSLYTYGAGEVAYDDLMRDWQVRWKVDVAGIMEDWVTATHEQYFKVKDAVVYKEPGTQYCRAEAKILNAGKSGGYVTVEHGAFYNVQRSICYIEAGEAKTFSLVTDGYVVSINTGLSANRPAIFVFKQDKSGKWDDTWKLGEEWRTIPVSEFMEGENTDEVVVDDQDKGFELRDGNLTWLQRGKKEKPMLVGNVQGGGDVSRWKRVLHAEACGDSIRGYHYIGGGKGKSSATWRFHVPKAGRYRVMARVYKECTKAWQMHEKIPPLDGVIYYYTLSFGGQQQEVEVHLDVELSGRYDNSCWASLGEFDFPAGEASVTLSDKEVRGRNEIAIVADAVKWVKLE